MEKSVEDHIRQATGATALTGEEDIQQLWSGYGMIRRYHLQGCPRPTVVVKHIRLAKPGRHPRGWHNDRSHQRKLRSYEVELAWYRDHAASCPPACRIPTCLSAESRDKEMLLILEDLDTAGYPVRRESLNWQGVETCLTWLAGFHAAFMGTKPTGLWREGTYWHLQTRPDELAAMEDETLRRAAAPIDARLRQTKNRTLVHGDAKLANFCFSPDQRRVAAVDFQYTGGGCGMKDVAYFIGSCLDDRSCAEKEGRILDFYFKALKQSLPPGLDGDAVEAEWRPLYSWAWADFQRFLQGWSPGHWKINDYGARQVRHVLQSL